MKLITVKVTPKASRNEVKEAPQPDGGLLFLVYTTTVPEKGKANEVVLKLLAKHLGIAQSKLEVVRGHTARNKTVRVGE